MWHQTPGKGCTEIGAPKIQTEITSDWNLCFLGFLTQNKILLEE